jgi:hypothetical protein
MTTARTRDAGSAPAASASRPSAPAAGDEWMVFGDEDTRIIRSSELPESPAADGIVR